MRDHKLAEGITKILIYSYYESQEFNKGKTAKEILEFKNRAIDQYLGRNFKDGPIIINYMKTRIDRDVALIMDLIENHQQKGEE